MNALRFIEAVLGVFFCAAIVKWLFSYATNNAVKSVKLGAPTPAEAKIAADTKQQLEQNAAAATADEARIANAGKSDLLVLARDELWRNSADAPAANPGKPPER